MSKLVKLTPLEMSKVGHCLVVTPSGDERRRKFLETLEWVNEEYGPAFKRLAE